jgi:hypothetical protein
MIKALRVSLFTMSVLAVVGITWVGVLLVAHPQPIDPSEVAVFEQSDRMMNGMTGYLEPARTSDGAALMPGFPFVVSLIGQVLGPDLWEARALALGSLLLIALLVFWMVRLETQSWTFSMCAMAFVVLGHALLAERPGVARPDTFMMLLVLTGFVVLRLTSGVWGTLCAALILSATFFVDVGVTWFLAAATASLLLDESRRRPLTFMITSLVVIGGGYVALSQLLGPWFNFQVIDGPARALRLDGVTPLYYLGSHLLGKLALPTMAVVLSFAMPTPPWRGKGGLWTCMAIGAVVSGLFATQSTQYGRHLLLPGIVALSLLAPVSMQRITGHLSAWPGSTRLAGRGVVLAALALQFVVFLSCVSPAWWRGELH